MKWKIWKRNKAPRLVAEISQDKVPLSTLIRWYCYDLGIEDVNDLVKAFSLMPVSQEGEDFEKEASERRIDAVVPLMPFIEKPTWTQRLWKACIVKFLLLQWLQHFPQHLS